MGKTKKQRTLKNLFSIVRTKRKKMADERVNNQVKPMSQRKTVVMAHRGGNFGPDSSMKNFRAAVENGLEGIEFDIWLSKDRIPMVLHGGEDGQLTKYGFPD